MIDEDVMGEFKQWLLEWSSREIDSGDITATSVLMVVMDGLDGFLKSHPGIHDFTDPCNDCGTPVDGYELPQFAYEDDHVIYGICEKCFLKRGGEIEVNPKSGYRYGVIWENPDKHVAK